MTEKTETYSKGIKSTFVICTEVKLNDIRIAEIVVTEQHSTRHAIHIHKANTTD